MAGALVLRAAQIETEPAYGTSHREVAVRVQVEAALADRRTGPAGLLLGGVAVVLNGAPVDGAGDRVVAARGRTQDVSLPARDEPGRPFDPPAHRKRLVRQPARVALAGDLVQPAGVVEVAAAPLAGEHDLDRAGLGDVAACPGTRDRPGAKSSRRRDQQDGSPTPEHDVR